MITKKMVGVVILLIFFGATSCAHNNTTRPDIKQVLPRKAFVHLEKTLIINSCKQDKSCMEMKFRSAASGFIIDKQLDGVFIITAAHFCENSMRPAGKNINISASYKAIRLDGHVFNAVLLHYQRDIDVCLMYSKGMTENINVVGISPRKPEPGEKIFNIAAPASIVGPNMVPIIEGRYNGEIGNASFYTLPAYPGSSGSMILNEKGELIGMVHSVYMNFNTISLSTRYEDLKVFIKTYLDKFILYKDVMGELNLNDIFVIHPIKI